MLDLLHVHIHTSEALTVAYLSNTHTHTYTCIHILPQHTYMHTCQAFAIASSGSYANTYIHAAASSTSGARTSPTSGIYVCLSVRIYVCLYVCLTVHICVCICVCLPAHICACTVICMFIYANLPHTDMCVHIHAMQYYAYVHMSRDHACSHMCIHVLCVYIYMRTCAMCVVETCVQSPISTCMLTRMYACGPIMDASRLYACIHGCIHVRNDYICTSNSGWRYIHLTHYP